MDVGSGKDGTDDRRSKPVGILVNKQWAGLFPESNQYNHSAESLKLYVLFMNSIKLTNSRVLYLSI